MGFDRLRAELADLLASLGLNAKQVRSALLGGLGLTDLQLKALTTKEAVLRAFRRIGRVPDAQALEIVRLVQAASAPPERAAPPRAASRVSRAQVGKRSTAWIS